jgi:tryptophan-rich sensory protein
MNPKKPQSDLMAYSGAGVQMVLIIGIFVFLGRKLDSHYALERPWWTLGLAVFGVIVAMIYMLRAFSRITKK